jgi:hypothetical protein
MGVCNPNLPITCLVNIPGLPDAAAGGVSDLVGNSFAAAMRDGATWVIKTTVAWWIEVPAVDLTTTPVDTIRGYVQWLAVAVAVAGVMWQGILLALSRRPQPLLNVGRGLFYLALWSSIGVIGPAAALRAGDAFSTWVLDRAAGGQAADRLVQLASLSGVSSAGAVVVLGLLMMLAGLVQAVLMLFREGAIVILAGVVVLAAAGSFTNATRPWLPRVVGWMLALICYKPAAALVYAAALAFVGQGHDARTVVVGLAMMILAIVALPVLMKFFTWTTGAATSGEGGGIAALAGASAAAIHARAALGTGSAHSPARQAAEIRADLGPSGPPPPGGNGASGSPWAPQTAAPSAPPPGGAAPSAAGTSAAATSGTAAAAAGPAGVVVMAAHAGAAAGQAAGRAAGEAMTNGEQS